MLVIVIRYVKVKLNKMASCKGTYLPAKKAVKIHQTDVLESEISVKTRTLGWNNLAHLVLFEIFCSLPYRDRASAALACRWWYQVYKLNLRTIWKSSTLHFERDSDVGTLKALKRFASHLEEVTICVRQVDPKNRRRGLRALELLKKASNLKSVKLESIGENQMCRRNLQESCSDYGYIKHLEGLFVWLGAEAQMTSGGKAGAAGLTSVDLGQVRFCLSGYLLDTLTLHSSLTTLNLQSCLPDRVRWRCKICPLLMAALLTKCKNLSELRCCYYSVSDGLLSTLAEPDRAPLRILSIQLRSSDSNTALTEEAWRKLFARWPNHRSCVIFSGNPTLEQLMKYDPISSVVVCVHSESENESDIHE